MAKKTKKIEKEDAEVVQDKKTEKPKKASTSTAIDLKDYFSESFRDRLGQYIALNQEVLTLKANVEGVDQSDEINKRKDQMATKVEEAAVSILKD